jgi:hypothetical protein
VAEDNYRTKDIADEEDHIAFHQRQSLAIGRALAIWKQKARFVGLAVTETSTSTSDRAASRRDSFENTGKEGGQIEPGRKRQISLFGHDICLKLLLVCRVGQFILSER